MFRVFRRRRCRRTGVYRTIGCRRELSRVTLCARQEGLTNRRTRAKAKQKTSGPARSASSMMCSSTLLSGLSTVRDFARICDGLTPISIEGATGDQRRRFQTQKGNESAHPPSTRVPPQTLPSQTPPTTFPRSEPSFPAYSCSPTHHPCHTLRRRPWRLTHRMPHTLVQRRIERRRIEEVGKRQRDPRRRALVRC